MSRNGNGNMILAVNILQKCVKTIESGAFFLLSISWLGLKIGIRDFHSWDRELLLTPEFWLTWVLTNLSSDTPEFWLTWVLTHLSSDSPEFWLTWVLTHLRVSMYEWIKTSMKGRSRLNASQTSIILTQDIFGKLFETLMNIVVRTSIAANVWWHSYSLLSCNCSNITLITCEVEGDYRLKEELFEKVRRMADNVQQNWGCLSHRIVGSVGSGHCWFVYDPPTIDTLVTGMDNVPCVTNSEQKWRRAQEATFH